MSSRASLLLVLALAWPTQAIDDSARAWVQAHRSPAWEAPMRTLTHGARPLLVVLAGVGLLSGATGRAAVLEAAVALIPVNLTVEALKWTVGRTRPDGDSRRKNSAFPSSHAANAFAVATVIARRWRRLAVPIAAFALAVAFSRMYLDRHWLSDVSGGALIGVAGALLGVVCVERWKRANGRIPSA